MPETTPAKDRLREITAGIETGIQELFESEKYAEYLRTMSRFHRYSVNNQMLIFLQRPDATLVAGFSKWHDQFERSVLKGEKGIKIIAPTPFKKRIEEQKLEPDTKLPVLDADGNAVMVEKEITVPMFKVVSVFDVSQTDGKPLPALAADLVGDVKNYEVFMEALRRSSPVPVSFEKLDAGTDGYFSPKDQRIALREGMSEVQTVSAAVHEITHAKLHNRSGDSPEKPDRRTAEVEAESVSFAVCAYYGIATGENSFGYIAVWSRDHTLPELRESLETINKTANGLITDIDRSYAEICRERGIGREQDEVESAFRSAPFDSFAIYQIRNDDALCNYRFANMEELTADGLKVERGNYEAIYTALLTPAGTQDQTLEKLYEQFNVDRPADFTGHSLSVSDIIALRQGDQVSCHYVDNFGFAEIPNFLPPENYLRNAEMSTEDDYDSIDGIINNGPKQPEPSVPASPAERQSRRPSAHTTTTTACTTVRSKRSSTASAGSARSAFSRPPSGTRTGTGASQAPTKRGRRRFPCPKTMPTTASAALSSTGRTPGSRTFSSRRHGTIFC